METIIEQYKNWLISNSQSENTIRAYVSRIRAFVEYCGITDPKTICTDNVVNFINHIKTSSGQASCNLYLSSIRNFLDYNNILIRMPKSKTPMKKVVQVITKEEFQNIIIPAIENEFSDVLKTKAVLSFMYYCGLRIIDVVNLKRENFDFKNNRIIFKIKKQNIEKKIAFPLRIHDVISRYFISEAEESNAFNCTRHQIEGMFRKLHFILPEIKVHPHKFRKSFATNAYKDGMKLEEIQKILGHRDISTTQIYVQEVDDDEIIKKFMRLEAEELKRLRKVNRQPSQR